MNDLNIQLSSHEETQVMHLIGVLDTTTVSFFEKLCTQLIEQKRFFVVVDLAEVHYISSAGVGMLLGFRNDFEDLGGRFVLFNVSSQVERVLNILDLYPLFEHYQSMEEALTSFQ